MQDGFITTWYDQSGNGLNATQSSTAYQPVISNLGTISGNGRMRPALQFDGASDYLSTTASTLWPTGALARSMNNIGEATSGWVGYAWGSSSSNSESGLIMASDIGLHGIGYDTVQYGSAPTNKLHIATVTYDGSNVYGYVDKTFLLSASGRTLYNTPSNSPLWIGKSKDNNYLGGFESEIIIYGSVLSFNQQSKLETNQTSYYVN
jgi:trimeric autotransporter adhesin